MLRPMLSRNIPVVAVLIVLNVSTLLLFFYVKKQNNNLWASSDVAGRLASEVAPYRVPPATLTVTALQTSTIVVETVLQQPMPPPKPPGPAFCDACGAEDVICKAYGEHNLARSRVYEGANSRLRRVIRDALAGKPTKIGVLGGSVSKGHGLRKEGENWTQRFLEAWRTLFPKSETTLINGAVPASGSDYFSMCFAEHIDDDVDLVVVELLINDQRVESNAVAYEWLLRGLLELPKNPAVVNLHTIGLSFHYITTGGDLHTPVSEYYDAPVISMRNMLAAHIMKHPPLDEFYFYKEESGRVDRRHVREEMGRTAVSLEGHKVMADLLVAYFQRQVCAVERDRAAPRRYVPDGEHGLPGAEEGLDEIPRLRMFQKYDRESVTGRIRPTCQSITGTKRPLRPLEAHGWERWVHAARPDKPYLVAREPGARVRFAVEVGVVGRVRVTLLRSKTLGLGDAWCWLDGERRAGARVVSWWDVENINAAVVAVVSEKATPGSHMLTCELMEETTDPGGGHEFRLVAVDAA